MGVCVILPGQGFFVCKDEVNKLLENKYAHVFDYMPISIILHLWIFACSMCQRKRLTAAPAELRSIDLCLFVLLVCVFVVCA